MLALGVERINHKKTKRALLYNTRPTNKEWLLLMVVAPDATGSQSRLHLIQTDMFHALSSSVSWYSASASLAPPTPQKTHINQYHPPLSALPIGLTTMISAKWSSAMSETNMCRA